MDSEVDLAHAPVQPRTVPQQPLAQADSPHHVDTPATALVRQGLYRQLSGPDELLVLHAGRFDDARGLLRKWLTSMTGARAAIACVLDPGPEVSADAYWTRLHEALHRRRFPPVCDGNGADPFGAVLGCLSAQTEPVVLVLEDLHLLPHAVDRVDELLHHGAPHGLRVIISTRTDTGWSGPLTRSRGRRYCPPSAFRVEPEDVSRHLHGSQLDFDVRAAEIICRLTGGLPALAAAVCAAVPVAELARPRHLDTHIPAVVDREVDRAIADVPDLASHRRTLVLSAAADPLNRETLALVPPREDAVPMAVLDVLDRHGMASSSADDPGGPHRSYPEVIRASLLRLAERDHPEDLDAYRATLIEHWLDADRANDALKIAAAADDWARVIEIIRAHSETLYTRDYPVTMHDQILARVPEHLVADDPYLRRLRQLHHRFDIPRDTAAPSDDDPGSDPDDEYNHNANNNDDDDATVPEARVRELLLKAITLRIEGRYAASADVCDRIWPLATRADVPVDVEDRDAKAFGWVHIGTGSLTVNS